MEVLQSLAEGFSSAMTPTNLMFAAIGVLLGTAVGVLPGLGTSLSIALLLPLTYALDPTSALIMFAGIYYGGAYGGSTTSILLNTPGESSTVVTAIEGNLMAKNGRASQALATAAIGSFIAGTIGSVLLVALATPIASLAVSLGAPEYFAVMILAFVSVTAVLGASRVRGFAALGIGLMLGMVGLDPQSGQQRLTFGVPQLVDGLDIILIAVAVFAIGEALWVASRFKRGTQSPIPVGQPWLSKKDWSRSWKPWLRGSLLGFPFGAIPAGGAEIPTFLSYVTERKLSKHPEEFGKGAIEGVAGPEAANNSSAAGSITSMLTLGLPTSATTAVILAAFTSYGIQPGPQLMESQADLVWALIASLFIANTLLLLINLPLAPMWAKLLRVPRQYLYAGIVFFAVLGTYSVNAQAIDIVFLVLIGTLGFVMRKYGMPVLPLIVGVILGPRAELQLRRSLQISDGDVWTLVSSPLTICIYVVLAIIIAWPLIRKFIKRGRGKGPDGNRDQTSSTTPEGSHLAAATSSAPASASDSGRRDETT
jgi:putative tricarboxylic transport membrane protein